MPGRSPRPGGATSEERTIYYLFLARFQANPRQSSSVSAYWTEWTVSGPFGRREVAESAAIAALGSGAFTATQLVEEQQLRAIAVAGSGREGLDQELINAAGIVLRWIAPPAIGPTGE